jgi:hypothetical protein
MLDTLINPGRPASSADPALVARGLERPPIDYDALEAAIAHCDEVVRSTRRRLQASGLSA